MRKMNILIGLFSLLFGGVILYLSREMAIVDEFGVPGERFWPFCIACLFIVLGILQCIKTVIQRGSSYQTVDLSSYAVKRTYFLGLISIIYAVALNYLGFIVSSLLFIPAVMVMMNEKRAWYLAVASVIMVVVIWLFFTELFNSPLPVPEFMDS